jgi:cation-transporting ATPase 13A1
MVLGMVFRRMLAHRSKRWVTCPIENLLPGDLCSVTRAESERLIPADILLLSGTAVVNEAMLTGEASAFFRDPPHTGSFPGFVFD